MVIKMTLAPRSLVNFWAGYQVARFQRLLRKPGSASAAQGAIFVRLMAQFAGTEYGRSHHLTAATTYAQFQEKVPPRTYDFFRPLVDRMADGEADVLVPGRCRFFVESAGTTALQPKLLPVPEAMLAHVRRGLRAALLLYAARTGHAGVFLGRHVHIGASTALREARGAYCTSFDGLLALSLTDWAEANLYAPPAAIAHLPEGAEKVEATAQAMLHQDVTLLGGTPALACALALAACEAASNGNRRVDRLQSVWPNLECFMFSGAPVGLFAEALRTSLGPTVAFHEVYAGAEGIFAAQDENKSPGLRLLADAGVFFEFLPLHEFAEATLGQAGSRCLPVGRVRPGTDYLLLVTTPAGLCRYAPGDIVRFLSVDPPRLEFVGRTANQLNTLGEHVSERELLGTLQAVCTRNGWQAVSFHVAPFRHRNAPGQTINCHEWWLELRTHSTKTPTANVLAPELDRELAGRNPEYAARRSSRVLEIPTVRLVMPGVFDQWAREQNKTASASKMPRCRPDRFIADQLAALARFHPDTEARVAPSGTRSPV